MELRYIVGRSGAGKTYLSLQEIVEELKNKEEAPLIFLVPEQFTFQSQKNLIQHIKSDKELNQKGSIRAEVLSFHMIAYRIFQRVGGITKTILSDIGKDMMIGNIMEKLKKDIFSYGSVVKQPGFIQNTSQLITEMKRYEITPEMLMDFAQILDDKDEFKYKLLDISKIYQEFEVYTSEKYLNMDDFLGEAVKRLNESSFLENAQIWIDGFYGFTPQQMRVLEVLFQRAKKINITVTMDPDQFKEDVADTDLFYSSFQMIKQINLLASKLNIKIRSPLLLRKDILPRFVHQPVLRHLEKQLYSYPYRVLNESPNGIEIFACFNLQSEVEKISRKIIELVREQEYRYRDIMVTCRNLESYEKYIQNSFKEHQIPYFLDRKRAMTQHPLIRMIQCLLEIKTKRWSYEAVFGYLKTGLTPIPMKEVDIIENYVLAHGIKEKQWTMEKEWVYVRQDLDGKNASSNMLILQEEVNKIKFKIKSFLDPVIENLKQKKSVQDYTKIIFEHLIELDVPEKLSLWAKENEVHNQFDLEKQNKQIWDLTVEVFDQAVEVMGKEKIEIKDYEKLLHIGFSRCEIGIIPPSVDQVLVGDIERSRTHDIKALFVLGVNDGVLPRVMEEKGILSDIERKRLTEYGMQVGPDGRKKIFEEQFLIYSTVTRTSCNLYFSYALADFEGKSLRPSFLINRLKKIFPLLQEETENIFSTTNEIQFISIPRATFGYFIKALRQYVERENMSSLWWDVYHWYIQQDQWKSILIHSIKGLFYTNLEEKIEKKNIPKLYGNPIYTSASKLERFTACPFSYFMLYGMKAKKRKKYELSIPEIGILFHKVLSDFSKSIEEKNISWKDVNGEQCNNMVADIMDSLINPLENSIFNSSAKNQYLLKRFKRIISRAIWALTKHVQSGMFEPNQFEIGFSDDEDDLSPMEIMLSNGQKMELVGRVDRVDIYSKEDKTYLKIIDYKSGTKIFDLSEVFYGMQLQLILYLDALLQKGEDIFDGDLFPAGVFYFKIDDPIVEESSGTSKEDIEESILKQLRMSGLTLADMDIVKAIDKNITKSSKIIPVGIKKEGDFSKDAFVATKEQFDLLINHCKKIIQDIGEEILEGSIRIAPIKQKNLTSCTYCDFRSICQFDTLLKNNEFINYKNYKKEEIWNMLQQEKRKEEKSGE